MGVTVAEEQVALGRELCKGLPVEFRLQDYRDVKGKFDHVVSVGMFEHVGPKNYDSFFRKADECLKDDGLLLLLTIGNTFSDRSAINSFYRLDGEVARSVKSGWRSNQHNGIGKAVKGSILTKLLHRAAI